MTIKAFTDFRALQSDKLYFPFRAFVEQDPNGSYFQSGDFFQLCAQAAEFQPVLFVAQGGNGQITGTLLSLVQVSGSGLKAWFSRRMTAWGGPLTGGGALEGRRACARQLLEAARQYALEHAIYMEFRNLHDTSEFRDIFEGAGFDYIPYLNFLLRTEDKTEVSRLMSRSRKRQIKSSLAAGAEIAEAGSEEEVMAFYQLLRQLYAEKVKKPLAGPDLFLRFWRLAAGKFFIVKYQGEVVGGNVCPVFGNRTVYEWYRCGRDSLRKDLHPSVLATWAPIEFAAGNGFQHFDFMGAGRPDEAYGVREFKARFGGEEVCYGRYSLVLDKALYSIGKLGIKIYQMTR